MPLVPSTRAKGDLQRKRRRALKRAAHRELEAAKAFGVERVKRGRFESAPDLPLVTTPSGHELRVEVKTRARLPSVITAALAQATRYGGGVPVAVISHLRGRAIVALSLDDFLRLLGMGRA